MAKATALFVGAHPDDIEIGCGGTVAKLCALQWSVYMLIMTREADDASRRKREAEAIAAAERLGVPESNILFAGFQDGFLVENADTVSRVRTLVASYIGIIDIVFAHSLADQHNDHRACAGIIISSLRNVLVLGYSVTNSVNDTLFNPKAYIDISKYKDRKLASLSEYRSQIEKNRIQWGSIAQSERSNGHLLMCDAAESFEILVFPQDPEKNRHFFHVNDYHFTNFWYPIIDTGHLHLFESFYRGHGTQRISAKEFKESEGIELLRQSFVSSWPKHYPIRQTNSEAEGADKWLSKGSVLISGGSVSNRISREYFSRFDNIRYEVVYSMPGYRDVRIYDKKRLCSLSAKYDMRLDSEMELREDIGILTVMPNPMNTAKKLIGCMGIHGLGTKACFVALTSPPLIKEVVSMTKPLEYGNMEYLQVLLKVDSRSEAVEIVHDSWHYLGEG